MDKLPKVSGFDWDKANIGKCGKHGVTAQEIEALLSGTPHLALDAKHSTHEGRFLAVGRNHAGRHIFVAFTLREKDDGILFRPISARYMHKKEIDQYEKKSTPLQK